MPRKRSSDIAVAASDRDREVRERLAEVALVDLLERDELGIAVMLGLYPDDHPVVEEMMPRPLTDEEKIENEKSKRERRKRMR